MAVASFLLFSISVVWDLGGSSERIHNVVPRPNGFLSARDKHTCVNGLAAEACLAQKDLSNDIEPTLFALGGSGVARKRRELRVRSDGCRPPQPNKVSDLIGRWPLSVSSKN